MQVPMADRWPHLRLAHLMLTRLASTNDSSLQLAAMPSGGTVYADCATQVAAPADEASADVAPEQPVFHAVSLHNQHNTRSASTYEYLWCPRQHGLDLAARNTVAWSCVLAFVQIGCLAGKHAVDLCWAISHFTVRCCAGQGGGGGDDGGGADAAAAAAARPGGPAPGAPAARLLQPRVRHRKLSLIVPQLRG